MAAKMVLSDEQRRAAEEDGYFVIEGVITPDDCKEYLQRLDDYAHGRRPVPEGIILEREPRVARGELAGVPGEDIRKIAGVARGDELFRKLG